MEKAVKDTSSRLGEAKIEDRPAIAEGGRTGQQKDAND